MNPNLQISATCRSGYHDKCKNATCRCGCHDAGQAPTTQDDEFLAAAQEAAAKLTPALSVEQQKVVECERTLLIAAARVADTSIALDEARDEGENVYPFAVAHRDAENDACAALDALVYAHKAVKE